MPEVIYRKIVPEDRERVEEICKDVFDGNDYVPKEMNNWMADPSCYFVGQEVDGKLVGLCNLRVLDEGKTGWEEGLRVCNESRGNGYGIQLHNHVLDYSKNTFKNERVRYTTCSVLKAALRLAQLSNMREELKHVYLRSKSPLKILNVLEEKEQTFSQVQIEEVSPSTFFSLILSMPTRTKLFPRNILNSKWKIIDIIASNERLFEKASIFITKNQQGEITTVSHGSLGSNTSDGFNWSATIYSLNEDESEFLAHLHKHFKICIEKSIVDFEGFLPITFPKILEELYPHAIPFYQNAVCIMMEKNCSDY